MGGVSTLFIHKCICLNIAKSDQLLTSIYAG